MRPPAPMQTSADLLTIKDLRVAFSDVEVLHGVNLQLERGRIHALIGESGSGKSVLTRSILGLAGRNARTTGSIAFVGHELTHYSPTQWAQLRGAEIGIVVQDAMSALNPMRTLEAQLVETIRLRHPAYRVGSLHTGPKPDPAQLAFELLQTVGITAPEKRLKAFAHELSGGMRQRVMIALALAGQPSLLIADEPTTALDVVVQRELLNELKALVKARQMALLLVTHDLHLAHDVADDVSVMYAGHILESGPVKRVLSTPAHPYTAGLLAAMPGPESPKGTLQPIKGEIPPPDQLGQGCPFYSRCPVVKAHCASQPVALKPVDEVNTVTRKHYAACTLAQANAHESAFEDPADPLDEAEAQAMATLRPQETDSPVICDVRILKHTYTTRRGFFGRATPWNVLEDIYLTLRAGRVTGLVGESGCGKSTLARLILGLNQPTAGVVNFKGMPQSAVRNATWRRQRASMQMIFQDPYGSFDARQRIVDAVAEPLRVHLGLSARQAHTRALDVLKAVGLPEHHADKRPGVMSGGQLQRAAIARAVALEPALLVCDEPVASLDVSIQAQVLELINRLRHRMNMAVLFVSHNLNVVRYVCDDICVMYLGRIIEKGPVDKIFTAPRHPYTQLLLASSPGADDRPIAHYPKGAMPSPIDRPPGCAFASRCPHANATCLKAPPPLQEYAEGRHVACYFEREHRAFG